MEITVFDAAHIISCTPQEARDLLGSTPTLESAEAIALDRYRWKAHVDDPGSYWVTAKQATQILGVSTQRVKQLLDNEQIPYAVHHTGIRLMRREQLETVANVRQARRFGAQPSPPG